MTTEQNIDYFIMQIWDDEWCREEGECHKMYFPQQNILTMIEKCIDIYDTIEKDGGCVELYDKKETKCYLHISPDGLEIDKSLETDRVKNLIGNLDK